MIAVYNLSKLLNFCLTDISIFLGARSNVSQTNWLWENGTIVNDSRYPPSNQSVCQQMSMPLTYDDGVNLLPKRCNEDEAFYACSITCKVCFMIFNNSMFINVYLRLADKS